MKKKYPFLIAEIGINHNGDIDIAKKLIDIASLNRFDAVKFQKRNINLVYSKEQLDSIRHSPWGKNFKEQKEGIEFNEEEYDEINDYCVKKKIHWFASAWDLNSLEFLKKYKLKFNKIASPMIVDEIFLIAVAKESKHTFISTGMSSEKNIQHAVDIFRKENCSFELMHCVSNYPAKPKDINLSTINELRRKFNCDVGYSGHENGTAISLAACAYGITSLERHITLDRTMYGSDQAASLEITGINNLGHGVRLVCDAIGEEKVGYINDEEKEISKKLRSHLADNNK